MKKLKKLALAIATVVTMSAGSMIASTAPTMAAGAVQVPSIVLEGASTGVTQVHYRSYGHRHNRYKRRYRRRYRNVCNWIKKRYWDQYDYVYRYRRVKVCKRVYY